MKTWFNQPGRKQSRRIARQKKAARDGVRPIGLLRPAVHPPTQRYNMRIRKGRGFTLEELKAAKISPKVALSIGIAVDHRRKNRSAESLKLNTDRLRLYLSKLALFPRGSKPKKGGAGIPADINKKDMPPVKQQRVTTALPLPRIKNKKVEARVITEEEKKFYAYGALRRARREAATVGKRKKDEGGDGL